MKFELSKQSSKPIYEQIKEQVKTMILNDDIQAGDKLPSMRQLAKALRISVITTQRAYEDLQNEGYIETIAGKGTYIKSSNTSFILDEQLQKIEQKVEDIVIQAKQYGVKRDMLISLINEMYQEENEE